MKKKTHKKYAAEKKCVELRKNTLATLHSFNIDESIQFECLNEKRTRFPISWFLWTNFS